MMIELLAKLVIKNSGDVHTAKVREQYGVLCGAAGVFFNVVLCLCKLAVGTAASSVAVTADALNNLSDAAASVITVMGFKLSGKKPDAGHPFGHGRMEYVAGLVISFLILIMGFELLQKSVSACIHPVRPAAGLPVAVILVLSIFVKFYMYFYNHGIGKKLSSSAMEAAAKDSLSDTISTAVVLASVLVSAFFPQLAIPFDGIAGVFVALFILYSGFSSAKDTIDPLLGVPADSSFVRQIEAEVMRHKPILGVHDLVVHDYGPCRVMISLHAEVPGDQNIFAIHEVIDKAESDLSEKFGCSVTIHIDPIDTGSGETAELLALVSAAARQIDPAITIHDLRVAAGRLRTNVSFDVVKPYSCTIDDSELCRMIEERVKEKRPDCACVIKVDQPLYQ